MKRSKKFHNFVELCLIKDYLIRSNCEQLLKHSFIRDSQEKQMKLQMKEYLDKTRKYRRSSTHPQQQQQCRNEDFQKQLEQQLSDEDEDDDDDDDEQIDTKQFNLIHFDQQQHLTQRENQFSTLRENFKSVQINSNKSSSFLFFFFHSALNLFR